LARLVILSEAKDFSMSRVALVSFGSERLLELKFAQPT